MRTVFKYLVAPIILSIIVIGAQFFIQPRMEKRITAQTELWLQKKQAYIETIKLIDKKFDSLQFKDSAPTRSRPTDKETNDAYTQLLFFCDNEEIIIEFQKFMDVSKDYCSPANRGSFIKLLREDLGKSKLSIVDEEVPYFRWRKTE